MIIKKFNNRLRVSVLVVGIVLLTAVTFYFFPSTSPLRSPVTEQEAVAKDQHVSGEDIPNIEEIAEFNRLLAVTVRNGVWEHEHIGKIAKLWRSFNDEQRSEIEQYRIFKQFNQAITGQILVQRTRSQRNDIVAIYQERALIDVAKQLGLKYKEQKKPPSKSRQNIAGNDTDGKPDSEISAEELEQASLQDQQKILQQLASVNGGDNNGRNLASDSETLPPRDDSGAKIKLLSSEDADRLMKRYVSAYQSGNLSMMNSLFLGSSRADSVNSEYKNLFLQTKNRELEFKTASWSQKNDAMIGSINYTLSLQDRKNNQTLREIGNIDVVVNQQNGTAKIARLEFKNSVAGSIGSADKQNQKEKIAVVSKKRNPSFLNENTLNSIISNFSRAYSQGNINDFMALFSVDARADDKTTLEGIEKDYRQLFSSTDLREMTIQQLKWNIRGNTALGKGKLKVKVKNKTQDFPVSVFGEIEFRVENRDGRILIHSIRHDV